MTVVCVTSEGLFAKCSEYKPNYFKFSSLSYHGDCQSIEFKLDDLIELSNTALRSVIFENTFNFSCRYLLYLNACRVISVMLQELVQKFSKIIVKLFHLVLLSIITKLLYRWGKVLVVLLRYVFWLLTALTLFTASIGLWKLVWKSHIEVKFELPVDVAEWISV